MRILMVIDGLPGGGAEKVLLTLAKGLLFQGHRVSLFSLRSVCDYTIPEGIEYKVIVDHMRTPWRKFTELARRIRALDEVIRESQQHGGEFDLVLSHLHRTDRVVARSRILPPDRVWFCLHTMFSLGYLEHRQGFSLWIKRIKINYLYKNRNLVAVSRGVLEDMRHVFKVTPNQAVVIYNPFDFSAIQQLAKAPCDLADQNYLIYVGRLHKNKRHDRLLKAYAESGIQAPLVILGKGSANMLCCLKSLARELQIGDRVLFKEFDINPYPYIYHARMLILSSDSEGFGNVLVEALICQTPVVSTRCPGGPVEILKGELSVGLAEMNITSLATTMREIYHHPPIISPLHLMDYDIVNICQQYISLVPKES